MSISLHLQCFSGDRTPVQHTLSAALPMALSLMHIKADRLDDLLRRVFSELLKSPNRIKPRRGHATELAGVLLHLTNPRARLSRTETKGRLFLGGHPKPAIDGQLKTG